MIPRRRPTTPRSGCGCPRRPRPAAMPRPGGPRRSRSLERRIPAVRPPRARGGRWPDRRGTASAGRRRLGLVGDPHREPVAALIPAHVEIARGPSATTGSPDPVAIVGRPRIGPSLSSSVPFAGAHVVSADARSTEPSQAIAKRPVGSTTGRHRSPASASARVAGSILNRHGTGVVRSRFARPTGDHLVPGPRGEVRHARRRWPSRHARHRRARHTRPHRLTRPPNAL